VTCELVSADGALDRPASRKICTFKSRVEISEQADRNLE